MKRLGILAALMCVTANAGEVPRADVNAAKSLAQALDKGDKKAVAALFVYPIGRPLPLAPIRDAADFVKHWDELFDAKNTARILEAQEPVMAGWRGAMVGGGLIWIHEGKIFNSHLESEAGRAAFEAAKKADNAKLHPSVAGYDALELECTAPKQHLRVRVERFGKELTYAAWKDSAALSDTPQVVVKKGTLAVEGTSRVRVFTFDNAGFRYVLSEGTLTVSKGDKELSSSPCQ
jgi:hypothetical protein